MNLINFGSSIRLNLVHPPIDGRNFLHPLAAVSMFQVQDGLGRPVKMIGNKGYLLGQLVKGVA